MMLARAAVSTRHRDAALDRGDQRLRAGPIAEVGHRDRQPLPRARDQRQPLLGSATAPRQRVALERVQQVVERVLGIEPARPS